MSAGTKARALRVLNMRRNGAKLSVIARELGVSKQRAQQLSVLGNEVERRMHSTDPWDELSNRIRHALHNDGCDPTLDAVSERYVLDPYNKSGFPIGRVLNIGRACIVEIQRWLVRHGREPLP
jgi:hypothetical protein